MWQPSHPAWGEWIEIFLLTIISKIARSLTPHGASGLKSHVCWVVSLCFIL